MKNTVEDFIHEGSHFHRNGFVPDLSRCRFSVYENDRAADHHQCNRKWVKNIKGYGFCQLHADEVETRLGIREGSTTTKYAASFRYGAPVLIELTIHKETDATIDIKSTKEILGSSMGLYAGKSKKNSQYTRGYEFFDNYNDAILYLYQESEDYWNSQKKSLEKSIETMNKLAGMVRELSKS